MDILLDADTLLEFFLNRSDEFINKVNYLSKIFGSNSSIQIYISKPGLDKIAVFLKALNGLKISNRQVSRIKKRIKILRLTKAVAQKARLLSDLDYESAVEIQLAIKANIGAIVTHKPSDFSSEELNIITLSDLPQRNQMEGTLSKNIKDLPAVLVINPEQISNLDKAFYHLPSYTGVKSLEPKESSHQLDLTCSSNKVFSPSGDELLPRSTYARSIEQIIADSLSNRPAFGRSTAQANILKSDGSATACQAYKSYLDVAIARSTAQANILKSDGSATACRAYKSYLDVVKESIHGLNASVARISEIQSSLVDRLSIKPPLTQLIAHPDAARFGNLAASIQVGNSSLINRLLPEPVFARTTACADILKSIGSVNAHLAYTNPVASLAENVIHTGKAYSSLVDGLSIKPVFARSTACADIMKSTGIAVAHIACENPFDKMNKITLQAEKKSSLAIERLSIKPPNLPSFPQFESKNIGDIAATALQAHEGILDTLKASIDRSQLSIKSFTRSTAHIDYAKPGNLIPKYLAKSSLNALRESIIDIDRLLPQSLLVRSAGKIDILKSDTLASPYTDKIHYPLMDRLSIEPLLARSTAYIDIMKSTGIAVVHGAC